MASAAAPIISGTPAAAGLRQALRRSRRKEQLQAAALVLPLFIFLLATFIVPIGAMLGRALFDREVAGILPRVTAELAHWDGRGLPPDAAYGALIDDVRAARAAGNLASAATRLNYDVAGFRSLFFATGRRLGSDVAGSPREILGAIDPKWNDIETWAVIRRAAGPVTDFYLLAALDLRRDAHNAITQTAPEQAVFRNVLGRTLWISGVVTLVCLLLGYPVAYFIARQAGRFRNGALVLHFTLPFKTPFKTRQLALEIYDPTFFVDFGLEKKDPIRLVGAPVGCGTAIQRPSDGAAGAKVLNEDTFMNGENSNYGAMFANKITVDCP